MNKRGMNKQGAGALLALLLVLAQAIAVHAQRPVPAFASGWMAVCTADGLRRLPADDDSAPGHEGEHCTLCRLAEPTAGAAPRDAVSSPPPRPEAVSEAAIAFFAGRPVSHDAPPRAPPAAA